MSVKTHWKALPLLSDSHKPWVSVALLPASSPDAADSVGHFCGVGCDATGPRQNRERCHSATAGQPVNSSPDRRQWCQSINSVNVCDPGSALCVANSAPCKCFGTPVTYKIVCCWTSFKDSETPATLSNCLLALSRPPGNRDASW